MLHLIFFRVRYHYAELYLIAPSQKFCTMKSGHQFMDVFNYSTFSLCAQVTQSILTISFVLVIIIAEEFLNVIVILKAQIADV